MRVEDDDPWADYETGPFCRHWGDPGDCVEMCKCGHSCVQHDTYDDRCEVKDCQCEKFDGQLDELS